MTDQITEVTEQGWLSRLGGSIKGVLIGLVLFVAAFPLLWWNEGRAVQTYKSLKEGAGSVISVAANEVDAKHENKLVHLSGKAVTTENVKDPIFGVSAQAIRLIRDVEMYQWVEKVESKKEKKVGGKEVTTKTYNYEKAWKSSLVESSGFKQEEGHKNPATMPYTNDSWSAGVVSLGAFKLNDGLKRKISASEKIPFTSAMLAMIPGALRSRAKVSGDALYVGNDPSSPAVGDLKITFAKVPPAEVSVIAQQHGTTFVPYQTKAGDKLEMLSPGIVPAAQMFAAAQAANVMMTWILRLIGFVLMFVGLSLIFRPLAVVADLVPMVGDILRMGFGVVSFAIALPLTLLTIAIAWLVYRPVLGVALLVVAIGVIVGIKMLAQKRKRASAPTPA